MNWAGLSDCVIAAAVFLTVGVVVSLIRARFAPLRAIRARHRAAISGAAKVLAAEPGSRLNTNGWADVLFDLHRAGFSLNASLNLVKRIHLFWRPSDSKPAGG